MKEHPIIFNGEMVRAILDNRKFQTRRMIKPQPPKDYSYVAQINHEWWIGTDLGWAGCYKYQSPYGQPGDQLWVRESFVPNYFDDWKPGYKADWTKLAAEYIKEPKWKASIHMPRWDSRITLEVVSVRVERVQEISEDDAKAEGVNHTDEGYRYSYCMLWNEINAKRGYPWNSNPWVWVIEFRKL